MNSIELFPTEHSCEQGCPACPLARKDRVIAATAIDPEVQETFSLLEAAFKNRNANYDLHFTSSFHLFPVIQHPELIHMSRFETSSSIRSEGAVGVFSENIRTLLRDIGISPKRIGVSIVPPSPAIDDADVTIISRIIDELVSWHFQSKNKEIEITIRSNMVKFSLYNEILPLVFERDFRKLPKLIEQYGKLEGYKMLTDDAYGSCMYANRFVGTRDTNKIEVINRIMTDSQKISTVEQMTNQAFYFSPGKKAFGSYAIAPKGVMLEHSSVAINNPVLWLSHADFRNTFSERSQNDEFSFEKFSDRLILENAVMYKNLCKRYDKNTIPLKEFPKIFETARKSFEKK